MSLVGIASSILTGLGSSQQSQPSRFKQVQTEFQQLSQDLQSGNLSAAQADFASLSQSLPGSTQNSAGSASSTTAATAAANALAATSSTTSSSPILQAFSQLGQDLQSGNLTGAQQDFSTLQQDLQQNVGQQAVGGHHHHHHHAESSQDSSASAISSSSQGNPISQAFGQLAQSLQSGSLSSAQSAFATLQSDLQQIGGLVTSGSSSSVFSPSTGSLNVSA